MARIVKSQLTENTGYIVLEKIIPDHLVDSIVAKLDTLYPVRASSSTKKYAEKDDIKNLTDISVWWSQMVMDWPEVIEINNLIIDKVKEHLHNAEWYASDIVTIEKHSKWINPHIDTPHRFKKYNYDRRLLGVQAIVSLFDLDKTTGVTGVVPRSQTQDFNINLCYQGFYNTWFMKNCVQPNLPKGSVLFYNCRVLHSSMPNEQNSPRPALLLNYLDGSIIEDVKTMDNIWASNG
jgi:ectoine hydroxylase-related dioxygenase (phytanoyl-CoA dioxygenase family)